MSECVGGLSRPRFVCVKCRLHLQIVIIPRGGGDDGTEIKMMLRGRGRYVWLLYLELFRNGYFCVQNISLHSPASHAANIEQTMARGLQNKVSVTCITKRSADGATD